MNAYTKPFMISAAIAVSAALGACASVPPDTSLEEARAAVNRAEANPAVMKYDSIDLATAQQQLLNAEGAAKHNSRELLDHESYLAIRTAKLAEVRADEASTQQRVAVPETARAYPDSHPADATVVAQQGYAATATMQELQARIADTTMQTTPRGVMIVLTDNYFDAGRAPLKPSADTVLDGLAQYLLDHPERRVRVEGHMDDAAAGADLGLPLHRAEAVRIALVARGVDPMRSEAVGFGAQSPLAATDNGEHPRIDGVAILLSDSRGQIASR